MCYDAGTNQQSATTHSTPAPSSQPVEFNHAIEYVNKIKVRFIKFDITIICLHTKICPDDYVETRIYKNGTDKNLNNTTKHSRIKFTCVYSTILIEFIDDRFCLKAFSKVNPKHIENALRRNQSGVNLK